MEETERITLYDEAGNSYEYELIDIFELNEIIYGAFAPVLGEGRDGTEDELEVVLLKIVERNDKQYFSEIDDPDEEEEAFSELIRRQDDLDIYE